MSSIDVAPVRRGPLLPGLGRLFGWAITSYFGGRIDPITGRPGNHGGMDLSYSGCWGTEIVAPVSGELSQGWDTSGGGNWSGIRGDNGDYWGFGHAERYVWPGGGTRQVSAGDVIAFVGSTGASTGAHLHIAYKPKGSQVYGDPFDILTAFGTARGRGFGTSTTPRTGDEIDMASIEQLQTEFVNQDSRTRAFIDATFASKDARDRAFMTALILKATQAIGGDDAAQRLRDSLTQR